MKMTRLMCVCAAVAALLAMPVMAVTSTATTAKVPFEFVAGGKTMPAGEYLISMPNAAGVVRIMGDARGATVLLVGRREAPQAGTVQPSLVFEKSGGKYHLKKVWAGPNSTNIEVAGK